MPESTQPTATEQPTPWAGFKYKPVSGLANRQIARFLRTQRKNMRRFFQERGHVDLFQQLEEIRRDPRRNFMQKNRSFQRILNEHIQRSTPVPMSGPVPVGPAAAAPQAAPVEDGGGLAVFSTPVRTDGSALIDTVQGVLEVAQHDDNEPVIEE